MEKTQQEIVIDPFNPHDLTEKEWHQAFDFRRVIHDAVEPDEPYTPDEIWKRGFLLNVEQQGMKRVLHRVRSGDKLVGFGTFAWFTPDSSGYEENKTIAFVSILVDPSYRQRGIARKLLSLHVPLAKQHGIKKLVGGTLEEDGRRFITAIGGSEALANIDNRLFLKDVNWDMARQWVEEGERRNPETKLEEFDLVPEHRMKAYVQVMDATLRQVPTGDMGLVPTANEDEIRESEEKRQKNERVHIKLVTVEPDETISGVTWLTYDKYTPMVFYQGLTGVLEEHRGRGLGKWLKAETLLRAKDRYSEVEYIRTDNATTNAPMISINERLGFREYRRSYNLQVSLEAVEAYLYRKN